jgi:Concanavalin A-like lectin/glucanases superfamily
MNTYLAKGKLIAGVIGVVLPVAVYAVSLLYQATPPTIKWNKNAVQELTLTANEALTFSGGKAGERYTLVVLQDVTGGRSITWPTDVQWPDGVTPTLTSASNGTDVFEFLYDGTRYLGSVIKNYRATAPTTGLNAGLIHYWKLDESSGDAQDAVGNMTMTNINSTQFVAGKINNGADFELDSQNYLQSNSNLTNSTLTSYTSCFWTKIESQPVFPAGFTPFAVYDAAGVIDVLYGDFDFPSGMKLALRHFDSPSSYVLSAYFTTLEVATFHHICGSWDGVNLKLFLNGNHVASSVATTLVPSSERLGTAIGGQPLPVNVSRPNSSVDGIVDEVGFWARVLSASEISQLYNGGAGRSYPF